ncbi:MAG: polyprenyl synthetase family protein [Micrococcaceae bacterium]|nr:polyprenyl synthetase family protein [Micrococcaceae bacterium]
MAPSPQEASPSFDEMVQRILDAEQRADRAAPGLNSRNYDALCRRLEATLHGGKRTRPHLVHVAFRAFGGRDLEAAATLGAGFEMLHAALLMHDDVIDRDFVRRGVPTLGAGYRDDALAHGHASGTAEHAGHSASIIAGDILLAGSIRLAALASAGSPNARTILDVVHSALLASAAGELDDLVFSLSPARTPESDVLNMERLKTAIYSFEAPLQAGALLAGAPPRLAARLGGLGRNLGTAYQIIDDVLGTFGNPQETGKSIDSDLRSGKRTVLTAQAEGHHGFRYARDAYAAGRAGIEEVRSALADSGAEPRARALASKLVTSALNEARGLELPPAILDELATIGEHVLNRKK